MLSIFSRKVTVALPQPQPPSQHPELLTEEELRLKEENSKLRSENANLAAELKATQLVNVQQCDALRIQEEAKVQNEALRRQLFKLRIALVKPKEKVELRAEPVRDIDFYDAVMECKAKEDRDFKKVTDMYYQGANLDACNVLLCLLENENINYVMVRWLVLHGANVQVKTTKDLKSKFGGKFEHCLFAGSTPLMRLAMQPLEGTAKAAAAEILAAGADIHEQNPKGETALHMAAWCNQRHSVMFLLRHEADKTKTNKYGKIPYQEYMERYKETPEFDSELAAVLKPGTRKGR